jgi:RNA polymerase sigma factor (sigma-70 family)
MIAHGVLRGKSEIFRSICKEEFSRPLGKQSVSIEAHGSLVCARNGPMLLPSASDFCPLLAVGECLLVKMTMTTSQQLLAEYLAHGSETAFRELVTRYTGLVYSTALRLVEGDTHRAEDVTQTVFVDLARQARKLSDETMLGGWLYRATCFVAAKAMRSERRRQAREREAVEMNTLGDHSEANFAQVAPVLDEAINQLAPEDQSAILLRFFERLDFPSVGEALGSTEEAARKRVNRALDKLHDLLTARGVTLSATALGMALAAKAVEAAPAQVVASAAQAALAGAAAGHGTALTFLKGMTASKIGLSVASAVVLAGASWLAWSLWGPWWPAEPPALALNGTWTRLDKPQPLGHIVWGECFALDPDGQLFVPEPQGVRIQKRDRDGRWSLVAPERPSPGALHELACDDSGNLYVAEWERVLKRDREGQWTILATKGGQLGEVSFPNAIALDRAGNLYVCDPYVRAGKESKTRIMLRKPDGEWTLLAGAGSDIGEFTFAGGLALDAKGNLYVADCYAKRIQQRDVTGRWSEVEVDPLAVGGLVEPCAVAVDGNGALYVGESCELLGYRNRLLKRDADGHWSELATQGRGLGQFSLWSKLKVDSAGALYVGEGGNPRIQKRDPNGTWTVVCAASTEPGIFCSPSLLAVDSHDSLYVVDTSLQQVQKRDPQGRWTVVADIAKEFGESLDPQSIAMDREDNLYVVDWQDWKTRRLLARDSHGKWEPCMPWGTDAGQTQWPIAVSVDASDNLYLIDRLRMPNVVGSPGNRLQRRDRQGRWTVLAVAGLEPDQQLGLKSKLLANIIPGPRLPQFAEVAQGSK